MLGISKLLQIFSVVWLYLSIMANVTNCGSYSLICVHSKEKFVGPALLQ